VERHNDVCHRIVGFGQINRGFVRASSSVLERVQSSRDENTQICQHV
jgi:hypothetical protein